MNKQMLSLFLLLSLPLSLCAIEKKKAKKENLVTALGNSYLQAFAPEEDEQEETKPAEEPKATKPFELKMIELNEGDKYKIAFGMLNTHVNQAKLPVEKTIDPQFIRSMELVYGGAEGKDHLLKTINCTNNIISEAALAWKLAQPTSNIERIQNNQAMVRELVENPSLLHKLDKLLYKLKTAEAELFSFYVDEPESNKKIIQQLLPYFGDGWLKSLNKNSLALGALGEYTKFNNVLATGITALIFVGLAGSSAYAFYNPNFDMHPIYNNNQIRFGGALFAGVYGFMGKQILDLMQIIRDSSCYLQKRLTGVAIYLDTLDQIYKIVNTNSTFRNNFTHLRYLKRLHEQNVSPECKDLFGKLNCDTFKGQPSYWFSLIGRIVSTYHSMNGVKNELCDFFIAGGQIGALVSAAKLYEKHENRPVKYCFVNFVQKDKPYINAKNMWNPRLISDIAVPNNLEMGGTLPRHMILTGGNGLGKSTIMKGALYGFLIAQAFGIAPAESLTLTPFSRFMCHMNVTDNVAEGLSGFTAELALKDKILSEHKALAQNEFILTVFDELFKSTNPEDAATLSQALCREIAGFGNSMSFLATHLAPVTNLEREGTHTNYHPGSIPQPNGLPAKPTFKLEKGASFDHNAVALYNKNKGNTQ
jgi:hypothetical protein